MVRLAKGNSLSCVAMLEAAADAGRLMGGAGWSVIQSGSSQARTPSALALVTERCWSGTIHASSRGRAVWPQGVPREKSPAIGGSAIPCGLVLPAANWKLVEATCEPDVLPTALSYW